MPRSSWVALALAGTAAGCSTLAFRPAAQKAPADIVPVELLRRTDRWAVVIVANRDLTARRFAWVDSSVAPCKGGIVAATIDRADAGQRGNTRLGPGQRIEVGFPRGDEPWPFAEGPTAIDIEEVRPEGTSCQRISLTGPSPTDQWLPDAQWTALVDFDAGLSTTPTTTNRPISLGWFFDLTAGLGRWVGPVRLDATALWGGVACDGCPGDSSLFRTGVGAGATGVIWQGRAHALEIGAAYRRTVAIGRNTTIWFNGARLAITLGRTPPPIVGVQWSSARTGILGLEIFGEWLAPTDDRLGPQLMLGAGLKLSAPAF